MTVPKVHYLRSLKYVSVNRSEHERTEFLLLTGPKLKHTAHIIRNLKKFRPPSPNGEEFENIIPPFRRKEVTLEKYH